jgi:hypothetical protein
MKANTMRITSSLLMPLVLGLICAGIIYAVLIGQSLPLVSTPRAALIGLLILGMAMCGLGGIGQVGASGRWASPLAIVGYFLGAAILAVIVSAFTGWRIPLIQNDLQAVAAVAVLMAVKFAIGTASFFFRWL